MSSLKNSSRHPVNDSKRGVCAIGVGSTGVHVVSGMAGHSENITCIVLENGGSASDKDSLIHRIVATDEEHDLARLFEIIGKADLVFLVACLDEIPEDYVRYLRATAWQRAIRMFLVTQEPEAELEKRPLISIIRNGKRIIYKVPTPSSASCAINQLDGVIVVARDALRLRTEYPTDNYRNPHLMSYLIKTPLELIGTLVSSDATGFLPVAFDDLYRILRHGVTRISIGIGSGKNRGMVAVEKALSCLKQQQVQLCEVGGIVCIIRISSEMAMDEYADITRYLLSLTDDNADVVTGVVFDVTQGENLVCTIMAKEKYSGKIIVPDHSAIARWVVDTDDEMRSIPAFERKKWFINQCELRH